MVSTKENSLDSLRKFFAVSNAAFEFQQTISKVFGGTGEMTPMHRLHVIAKNELDRDSPDLELVDRLLAEMESEAEKTQEKVNNLTPKQKQ